jgi:hypothetical protein
MIMWTHVNVPSQIFPYVKGLGTNNLLSLLRSFVLFFLETLELGASIFTFFTFMFVYLLLVGHNRVQYIYITLNLLEEKDLSGMFTLLG